MEDSDGTGGSSQSRNLRVLLPCGVGVAASPGDWEHPPPPSPTGDRQGAACQSPSPQSAWAGGYGAVASLCSCALGFLLQTEVSPPSEAGSDLS